MQTVLSFFKKPYRTLFKDIKNIYVLLPLKLRVSVIALFALMGMQAAMELITIITITHLGKAMGDTSGLEHGLPYRIIFKLFPAIDAWTKEGHSNFLLLVSIVIVLCMLVKNGITFVTLRYTARVSEKVSLYIGEEMMERYLYSDYRWHISRASGKALQMMMWRSNIALLLVLQLSAITGFATCAVLFAGLIIQEPLISLVSMTSSISIGLILYLSIRRNIDKCGTLAGVAASEENKAIMSSTRGIRDVLIYGQQPAFLNAFVASITNGLKARVFLSIANTLPSLLLEVVGFAMIPTTILLLVKLVNAPQSQIVSAVMLLMLTAWRVLPYLNRGVGQMVSIRGIRPTSLPVLDFLRTLRQNHMELPPPPNPNFAFTKNIQLQNVGFSYPDTDVESLLDLNMTIPKGKFIGLIGSSGAGKSTLSNILCALCAPTRGKFMVDGKELDPADLAAFQRQVGFVPQTSFLMAGTLAENVAFSEWGKPVDEERVLKACEEAAIDFIDINRDGIKLHIGENGVGLSGGQAQRVSIARALYAKPAILIFDEATSALDAGNENIIVSSIEKLRGEVTCIIIAHRLSTVEHCDTIFWFDKGRLVAEGPPKEIIPKYMASYSDLV